MTLLDTVPDRADVIIVGGGIVGCATAYYLTRRGADVLLIERGEIGSGATGRSGGGVRQSARVSEELPLAMESVALFPALSDELGVDLEYTRRGNLRLVEIPDHVRPMQADVARQQKLGLDVRWLEPAEVVELVPVLKRDAICGASYCPTDGHVNPFRLVTGFYQRARDAGLQVLTGRQVDSIRHASADVVVKAGGREIRAQTVLIAAGAGSRALCLKLGFDLPLTNVCYESMITEALSPRFPQMFGVATGDLFFRQTRHGGVHFGGGIIEERDNVSTTGKNIRLAVEHLTRLVSGLEDVQLLRTWGGVDPNTPDGMPIIDRLSDNVLLATGFCGHGLAIGPIVGRYLAEWIAGDGGNGGGRPRALAPFRRDRFEGWLQTRWTPTGSFEATIIGATPQTDLRRDGSEGSAASAPVPDHEASTQQGRHLLVIEPDLCTGCRLCEVACALWHERSPHGTHLRIQVAYPSEDTFIPITCIHCEEVYCMEACPFDALVPEGANGTIEVIDDNCVGCMLCVKDCPYGGIQYLGERDTVIKCDLCGGQPSCAQYCPTQAITFAPLDDETWTRMKREAVDNIWALLEREPDRLTRKRRKRP